MQLDKATTKKGVIIKDLSDSIQKETDEELTEISMTSSRAGNEGKVLE